MAVLILGLMLFLGIHLVPAMPALRDRLANAFGDKTYRAIFSLISLLGLVLIVVGYARAPRGPQLFDPYPLAVSIAPVALVIAFVLLAAANMKTHIRFSVKHPMLIGVGIWALVHLLATGHSKATVLFGAFVAYAAIDLLSAVGRHAFKSFEPDIKYDLMAAVAGAALAFIVMLFHRWLFGSAPVAWSM